MQIFSRVAAGVVAALLALTVVACGGRTEEATDVAATPGPPDPAVLAREAADRIEAMTSFHFVVEHENGGTPIVLNLSMTRAEGDMVKPDRLRADVEATATQLGNANVKVKVVNVGDRAMITNPFNVRQWVPLPGESRLADIFDPGAGTTAALRSATDLQITGEETIGGVKVWRLEGNVAGESLSGIAPGIAEPGYTAKGTVWIGQADPLVYRIRLDGPLGPRDPQNIVRKIDLSKFDEDVSIELPSG